MKRYICIIVLCIAGLPAICQHGSVTGRILADDAPMAYVNVALEGSSLGDHTDENGHFRIDKVPAGSYRLVASAVGFRKWSKMIVIDSGATRSMGTIHLHEDAIGMNEVVVTGTMKPTFVTSSPVKVEVVTAKHIETYLPSSANLMESVALINGVQEVVACGVCFTSSISINGLPGQYTAVLMDGTPMYGNLASVYALDGIPNQIIDRIEVIKGPSSTLYGSEAVAGVINVITRDPEDAPFVSADVMATTHRESFGNITLAPSVGKFSGYASLNYAYINIFEDQNEDGFGDLVNTDRYAFFTKWQLERPEGREFTIAAKYYLEDRRNGVREYLEDRAYREIRGNDSIYGESIYTNRLEVFGSYSLPFKEDIRLDYSFSNHRQDSYYGSDQYIADQTIGFGNLYWRKKLNRHQLLAGATFRLQDYDDNTVATGDSINGRLVNEPNKQFIPGLFIQDEFLLTSEFTLMPGLRLDHYEAHGAILSPRLNLKYAPDEWTTFRTNFGTGFRVVNLFTEDHAFVTGQREVVIEEKLNPERSYNISVNANHVFSLGSTSGMLDGDIFYTYFTNKIIPDYEQPGRIIYRNTNGYAVSKGINFSLTQQFNFPLSYNIGTTLQEVTATTRDENGELTKERIEYAPGVSGVFTLRYKWHKKKITIGYTAQFTGSMRLPEVYDLDATGDLKTRHRPIKSEPYVIQNIQVQKDMSKGFRIYGGVQNLLNYIQPHSPVSGINDPVSPDGFSDHFDTAYAYGPLHGREFYLGVKWQYE